MPLAFGTDEVRLFETCGADEALELSDWFSTAVLPKVDLGGCTNLHPALLQTLLAYKPAISVNPSDPFIARWILPMLTSLREEE